MLKYPQWDVRLEDEGQAAALAEAGIPYLNALALAARGFSDPMAAKAFSSDPGAALPDQESLDKEIHDPFLLPDMDKAVGRIRKALETKEKIAVYGDYDVDGVTSVVLLYEQLSSMGGNCVWYIPNRLSDGHGLRRDVLMDLKDAGVSLVITVDTGVSAAREAEDARKLGLDLVITDHHECPETLPYAAAVVDPKRRGSAYPFAELAGVGVAFKLVCALCGDPEDALRRFGGLVALGSVADVVPLTEENRALVRIGLERLNISPRPGLKALMDEAGCEGRVNAQTISFRLAPRLNAAGRLDRADAAVELLMCGEAKQAKKLAALLGELNLTRKSIEAEVYEEAVSQIEDMGPEPTRDAIVLAGKGWHEGVIGIVAGKLAERYGVPALLISLSEEDFGKGSARGVPGVNLAEALRACGPLLEEYGGHEMAAGFRVRRENIPALREALTAFCREAAEVGKPGRDSAVCTADAAADPLRVNLESVQALSALEPFGAGNPEPVFLFRNVTLRSIEPIGNGAHTRLVLETAGKAFSAVWFHTRADSLTLGRDEQADILFTPEINRFREQESVQLHMRDIRPSQEQARRDREAWQAYLRFQEGERLPASEAVLLRPQRPQMGSVWRRLVQEGCWLREPLALGRDLAGDNVRRLPAGMVWVTLDVLAEYDLIELQKGPLWKIRVRRQTEKVDITQSKILAALDQLA